MAAVEEVLVIVVVVVVVVGVVVVLVSAKGILLSQGPTRCQIMFRMDLLPAHVRAILCGSKRSHFLARSPDH